MDERSTPDSNEKKETEMDSCCDLHPATTCGPAKCPSCGLLARPVERQTVGALLKPEARLKIPKGDQFCFCRTADCDVVYFRTNEVLFRQDDLTVEVHQKKSDDSTVPVCYCFGWTPKKIHEEIETTGKSTVIDQVKAQIKGNNCYCEVTNPQGSCCLGNVSKVARELAKK